MSDATERPEAGTDPWAEACAEDLKAEQARRRDRYGPPPGSAADELRKLFGAVADKVSEFQGSLPGMAAQSAVSHFVQQAKSAVEPVIERNPQVFDHLAAAGGELLAAYRSAVAGQESRWTQRPSDAGRPSGSGTDGDDASTERPPRTERRDQDPGPGEQIDLD
ncbi:DUF5304 domain-containing protein [Streptomyces clavuligerus]|nr:DUF5304 domain-containing protein [Streptomyces clavuligerus]MBY6305283.1 DUF5304 domain-containing protein [Streptomyces clavuligerus]QPL65210.1 DUF5304 domain-containing protein [Streptomyces clavuligerus]QPL71242.1 DUF5304 domain-containing protein [Streptomyces clavuligerus]QPL77324.1 DUF5304 domain-containing protein [Streptomyces clavuligerus]QPL83348.1 DUF5304 domain-containing protein [Streptomyces clavuligerus]